MAESMSIGPGDVGKLSLSTEKESARPAFCANCGEKTPHSVAVDKNGETVVTCLAPKCGRFHKYAKGIAGAALSAALERHEKANA